MNEPIVVARVRKAGPLVLKPGDWVVIVSPDSTFSEANKAFDDLLAPVNEKYSRIIIGKIQHSRNAQNPVTEEQNKAWLASVGEQSQKVSQIVAGAQERENKVEAKRANDLAAMKEKELKAHNSIIDKIRKATNYKA